MTDNHKHLMDTGAAIIAGVSLVGWLPSIAAALSIVWTAMRIYDWVQAKRQVNNN